MALSDGLDQNIHPGGCKIPHPHMWQLLGGQHVLTNTHNTQHTHTAHYIDRYIERYFIMYNDFLINCMSRPQGHDHVFIL